MSRLAPVSRSPWVGLLMASALACAPAWASPEEEIDTIDAAISDVSSRSQTLVARTTPGAYLSADEAITRYQDYMFLHMIGQHGPAAEGFFALVTTGSLTDAGMHHDAEWYLAESLAGLGNLQTAAGRFKVIVDDPKHPFRPDAVRRLLEIYAKTGDGDAFKALYDAEIVTGKVKATGLITYSLAKSFYLKGDRASARSYFQQVPADNEWFGRARYFLAVMDVEDKNLAGATATFAEVAAMSVRTPDDRRVHDLALLAQGRIAYDRKDFPKAYEAYTAISNDSEFQDQKLYETVWTSIRRKDWRDALNNVEIFLLAFPDHQYAAQLRLLQGHLNFQQDQWPDALSSYELVIQDYEPIRARFATLAGDGPESEAAVDAFLGAGARSPDLPEYALALMRSDPELGRTLQAFSELAAQRDDIAASEGLIEELRAFILGSGAASSYDRMVMDGHWYRSRLLGSRLSLLETEERWLGDSSLAARRTELAGRWAAVDQRVSAGAAQLDDYERVLAGLRSDVDNAQREIVKCDRRIGEIEPAIRMAAEAQKATLRAELETTRAAKADAEARIVDANRKISEVPMPQVVSTAPAAEIASLAAEIDDLARKYTSLRAQAKSAATTGPRIDAAHNAAIVVFVRVGDALQALEQNTKGELGAVRERFEAEIVNVAQERADCDRTTAQAKAVSKDATRKGFAALEDYVGGSVLKADMGIVDVYWAQKLDTDDELVAVRKEKDATLAELDRRFALIREKLGEEGGKK